MISVEAALRLKSKRRSRAFERTPTLRGVVRISAKTRGESESESESERARCRERHRGPLSSRARKLRTILTPLHEMDVFERFSSEGICANNNTEGASSTT